MAVRVYIEDMRQRLGVEPNDTSQDVRIEAMTPFQRLKLLCGWYLGDPAWASHILEWAKDSGFSVDDPAKR